MLKPSELRLLHAMHLHPTLTMAAESIGMAQPAASALLRTLESRLGYPLYTRAYRRLEMTSRGRALLPEILNAYASLEALGRVARDIGDGGDRRLTLGVVAIAAASLLPEALTRLQHQFPGLNTTLRAGTTLEISDMAADQRIDVGIVISTPHTERVMARPLAKLGLHCIFPPGHPLAKLRAPSLEDVIRHPYVILGPALPAGLLTRQALAQCRQAPPPAAEVMQSATACALVSAGMGPGIVETLGALYAERQGLLSQRLDAAAEGLNLSVIWSRRRPLSPLAEALIEEVTTDTAKYLPRISAFK